MIQFIYTKNLTAFPSMRLELLFRKLLGGQ